MLWGAVEAAWRPRFIWFATLMACHCASCFHRDKPAISPTPSRCWIWCAFPVSRGDHESAVDGYWLTKAMVQNTCVTTATVIECSLWSRHAPCHANPAWLAPTLWSSKVSAAQHNWADVWLAKREQPNRHSLRQAGQELRSHGHAGLQPTLYAAILFVQNLGWYSLDKEIFGD